MMLLLSTVSEFRHAVYSYHGTDVSHPHLYFALGCTQSRREWQGFTLSSSYRIWLKTVEQKYQTVILLVSQQDKRPFSDYFLDVFLIVFDRAF